ncbi:MAG TPA: hypothetical protein DCX22_03475 [Dehalococcoidia bacterium]|nr:hypothetical protein [Dehalococcoidia bacterium]
MAKYKGMTADIGDGELALRLRMMQGPETTKAIEKLYTRYGKDVISIAELRNMLDKEMGDKTLTEELYAMREG